MGRPKTIIHILSALDGRISGPFFGVSSVRAASEEYGRIRKEYDADAWLYGAVTTKEFTGFRKPAVDTNDCFVPEGDFVAQRDADLFYVSVDPLGEIGWESGTFRMPGRPDAHVIEILTQQTPAAYRSYLRRLGVSYLLAGEKELDCQLVCEKLHRLFGIQTLLICGGGMVNWSFLQQRVVDELSLVLAPAADGSTGCASVFDRGTFSPTGGPAAFHLKDVKRLKQDAIHLIYTVARP